MFKADLRPAHLAIGSRRIHYGWVIVVIASTIGSITSAVRFAATALVPHLRDSASGLGWSYGAITLGFSLQWFVLGIVSPYVGWLGDRYGARRLLLFGTFLFVAGMLLTGTMTSLWQFYLFFGVMLGVSTTVFSILLVTGVTLWFRRRLGVAMGAMGSVQGIGTIAFLFLIAVAFDVLGMKWIFWIPGIAGGAIVLLLIKFFYNEPGDIGLRPLGAPEGAPVHRPQNDDMAQIRAKVFLRQAQRTSTFWNLIGIHFWGCMGHNIINVLLVAIAVDRGLSLGVAAGVLATQQVAGVFARGAVPVIADRIGSKSVWGCRHVSSSLSFAPHPLHPRRLGFLSLRHPTWYRSRGLRFLPSLSPTGSTSEMSLKEAYTGWQNIGNGLGMGMAPVVAGFLWDVTGTSAVPLIMSLGFSIHGIGLGSAVAQLVTSIDSRLGGCAAFGGPFAGQPVSSSPVKPENRDTMCRFNGTAA